MARRFWAVVAALWLSACGGSAERDRADDERAGAGGTSATPVEPASLPLMDWPWFVGRTAVYAQDGVLSFSFEAGDTRVQLQTHHHFDLLAGHQALHFVAAANRPASMLASFTGLAAFEGDYWSDLAAGKPWLVAPFEVGVEQKSYDLPLESFSAQGPGTPLPMFEGGTVIWFLIENASGLDLALSEISLK